MKTPLKISFLWLLLAAFFACENPLKKDNKPQEPVKPDMAMVAEKLNLYCSLSKEKYGAQGYVHSKCDGLLFTSLHGVACSYVAIDEFQKEPGLWKRSPTHDCFAKGESRSGISNDMIIGLLLYAWQHQRPDIPENLIKYGEDHGWDMCGGEHDSEETRLSRCIIKPTLKATVYEVAVKLGYDCNDRCHLARAIPQVWNPHDTGFTAHLTQLHILLRGHVQRGINDNQLAQLRWQKDRVTTNALFQASYALFTSGDMTDAWEILRGLHFPADRLPGSGEHCTEYLWQRDPGADWLPCPGDSREHYGTDFLFASMVVLGWLRDGLD